MENLNDVLQHFGVRGMKWGRRRSRGEGQNGNKKVKEPSKLKKEFASLSRERQWKKTLAKSGSMSTKDINKTVARVQLENDLKKLSRKRNVGSDESKNDYLSRGKMSDQELNRKVGRLRAKESLDRVVKEASKEQMALGKEILTFVLKSGMDTSKN